MLHCCYVFLQKRRKPRLLVPFSNRFSSPGEQIRYVLGATMFCWKAEVTITKLKTKYSPRDNLSLCAILQLGLSFESRYLFKTNVLNNKRYSIPTFVQHSVSQETEAPRGKDVNYCGKVISILQPKLSARHFYVHNSISV